MENLAESGSYRPKDARIETLRGLAVLLLVSYHCIDEAAFQRHEWGFAWLGYSLRWLRIPLFTAISGYLFARRPPLPGEYLALVRGKARRLLLPWSSVTLITLALTFVMGKNSDLFTPWRAFIVPLGHLWFIPAIFWVFLITGFCELRGFLWSFRGWLMVSAVSWFFAIFLRGPQAFSFEGTTVLLPFFLLGFAFRRYEQRVIGRANLLAYTSIAALGVGFHQAVWWTDLSLDEYTYNALFLFASLALQCLVFALRGDVPVLARLGHFAFPIYLYHILSISLGTRMCRTLHVDDASLLFGAKLCAGLLAPMLLARVVASFPRCSLIFLGERTKPARVQLVSDGPAKLDSITAS